MKFQVLTLFPELIESFRQTGLVRRAIQEEKLAIEPIHLRTYAINAHGQVDDTPYGGGSGMVLRPEPTVAAIREAKAKDPAGTVIYFTPRGKPFTQALANQLCQQSIESSSGFILLCSRYEGLDERVAANYVDHEISLGDYVLQGGEIPALAFIEAVSRLMPGVLGNAESLSQESFSAGLLEYPQYTKPKEFEGQSVPEILTTGNHALIEKWREEQALADTKKRRPDLIARKGRAGAPLKASVYVALIHHPVLGKKGEIITSSITNLDLHDISRSARTFGLKQFYATHPVRIMRTLAEKICEHWETGFGASYNHNRSEALSLMRVVTDLDDVLNDIEEKTGQFPVIVATSAQVAPGVLSFEQLRAELVSDERPYLILLGTGWGLAPEILVRATCRLGPINGPGEYNHLSVRAAAAIIFEKLLGTSE
ncbi:tRNA (guanosine(37)-N1)-methyltransferase TrmD [bacterium]|nr:tRNA (guanosine(37)-N1)-methyltransferase TrmD [bacterium]